MMRGASLLVLGVLTWIACGGEVPHPEVPQGPGTVTSADGLPLKYEVRGNGPALMLVHGWSCDRTYWSGQVEPFARDYTVVTLDLAGHGESAVGRGNHTIASFGGDVAAVVNHLGLERVVLVGHSMGGDVIVEAARQLPGKVRALVWVDTYSRLGTPRTEEELEAIVTPLGEDFQNNTQEFVRGMFPANADPALVNRVALDMSAAPPSVALSALRNALSYDREVITVLPELRLPVIAINPAEPPPDSASLQRYGVEVVTMPGVGHFLMMEDAPRFNTLLKQVLDRLK